jgi:hypothetical protein
MLINYTRKYSREWDGVTAHPRRVYSSKNTMSIFPLIIIFDN